MYCEQATITDNGGHLPTHHHGASSFISSSFLFFSIHDLGSSFWKRCLTFFTFFSTNLSRFSFRFINMASYPESGYRNDNWQSEGEHYTEKDAQAHDSTHRSKRLVWRIFRLGAGLTLSLAAFILTIIILVVGRHGSASSDLSLITVRLRSLSFMHESSTNTYCRSI